MDVKVLGLGDPLLCLLVELLALGATSSQYLDIHVLFLRFAA